MKFLLQLAAALVFVLLMRQIGYLSPNLYIPFVNKTISMPEWLYFVFATFVIIGTVKQNLSKSVFYVQMKCSDIIFINADCHFGISHYFGF